MDRKENCYDICNIYALVDPFTDQIRYTGKTVKDPKKRLIDHISGAKRKSSKNHVGNWIRSLLKKGAVPILELLEVVPFLDWVAAEKKWIKRLRDIGCRLTNITDGGEGLCGAIFSEETREKIRKSRIGKKVVWTEEAKAKLSASLKGRKVSAETRAKISAKNKGQIVPLEKREAHSRFMKGRSPSKETREKLAKVWKGRKHRQETIEKMKLARSKQVMKKPTEEDIRKRSLSMKETMAKQKAEGTGRYGRKIVMPPRSEEHKRKLSECQKGKPRKKWTDEQRTNFRKATLGHHVSEETKKKISESNMGRKVSEEGKARMREAWILRKTKNLQEFADG